MRSFQFWWRTLVLSTQYNPPEFVEQMMASLAIALLMSWEFTHAWPYLVLSSSFAIGAAISMWVREMIAPSYHSGVVKVLAVLLLIYSMYAFSELTSYL